MKRRGRAMASVITGSAKIARNRPGSVPTVRLFRLSLPFVMLEFATKRDRVPGAPPCYNRAHVEL